MFSSEISVQFNNLKNLSKRKENKTKGVLTQIIEHAFTAF